MSQIVVMLYEDPTKDVCSEQRFHVELHFSPGVNCCINKNLPPGLGKNENWLNLLIHVSSLIFTDQDSVQTLNLKIQ